MSVSNVAKVMSLTIASGNTESNALKSKDDYGDAAALGVISPATLDAGTYKWQVSQDGTNWFDLQTGNPLADELVPGQGNAAVYYNLLPWKFIRISGPAAAADRVFLVTKMFTTP